MRYSGIQPQYFPRLHYFARIFNTDVFVLRDDVQFVSKHKYPDGRTDKSYQAHTPIKQSYGRLLLSVSIKHTELLPINQTILAYDQPWTQKHLLHIRVGYVHSPNFAQIFPEIKMLLSMRYTSLSALNTTTTIWALLRLIEDTSIHESSLNLPFLNSRLRRQRLFRLRAIKLASQSKSLNTSQPMNANEKIIALIKEFGANEDYCGGTAHQAYMDEELFRSHGIRVTIQDWKCREYPQLFIKQQGFIPNLSILDLLMNVSLEEARNILAS